MWKWIYQIQILSISFCDLMILFSTIMIQSSWLLLNNWILKRKYCYLKTLLELSKNHLFLHVLLFVKLFETNKTISFEFSNTLKQRLEHFSLNFSWVVLYFYKFSLLSLTVDSQRGFLRRMIFPTVFPDWNSSYFRSGPNWVLPLMEMLTQRITILMINIFHNYMVTQRYLSLMMLNKSWRDYQRDLKIMLGHLHSVPLGMISILGNISQFILNYLGMDLLCLHCTEKYRIWTALCSWLYR